MLPSRTSEEGYLLLNGKPIAEIECTIIEEVPRIDWWGSFRVKEEYQDKLAELFLELGVSKGLEIDLASYRGQIILRQQQLSSDTGLGNILFQGTGPLMRKGQ